MIEAISQPPSDCHSELKVSLIVQPSTLLQGEGTHCQRSPFLSSGLPFSPIVECHPAGVIDSIADEGHLKSLQNPSRVYNIQIPLSARIDDRGETRGFFVLYSRFLYCLSSLEVCLACVKVPRWYPRTDTSSILVFCLLH